MVVQTLKTIVTIIVMIITAIIFGIQQLLKMSAELLTMAKEATPSTVSILKEQAGVASVAGRNLADRSIGDLRQRFVPREKEKVSSN